MWRQGFLDVTTVGDTFGSPEFTSNVAEWLNKHQPISLVVNGDYALMRTLWEKSGMVVNTAGLGDEDASAALTAQARSAPCRSPCTHGQRSTIIARRRLQLQRS